MIIQTITSETMFIEAFRKMDRMDNFSIDGLKALYEFLEDMSQDTGKDYKLDVIALCCDFSEESVENIVSNYSIDVEEDAEDYKDYVEEVVEALNNETFAIALDNGKILYQAF